MRRGTWKSNSLSFSAVVLLELACCSVGSTLSGCGESASDPSGASGKAGAAGEQGSGGASGSSPQPDAGGDSGAAGAAASCDSPADCPIPAQACYEATCDGESCSEAPKPKGEVVADQTPGDCRVAQCDGMGGVVDEIDDTDLPEDGSDCTNDVCNGGIGTNPSAPEGTPCGASGGLMCDGQGQCVGCIAAEDCAVPTECQAFLCEEGTCLVQNVPEGTLVQNQVAGDCHVLRCDGSGGISSVEDNLDVPADATACTDDLCNAGTPSNPPVSSGTPCSEGAGSLCDSAGACVECLTAYDCGGQDTDCQTISCVAGACGVDLTSAGTPVSTQTLGDCENVVCDGHGDTATVIDAADVPDDENPCTVDSCDAGVPTHANADAGTPCGASGACDGSGHCVGCTFPTDCPGVDDECKTRTCISNACGFDFTPASSALANQTANDCKVRTCDGSGHLLILSDDSDVPLDDGDQCTAPGCDDKTPVFVPAAVDTTCTQDGGSYCDGAGQCVECTAASQCPPTTNECQVVACETNVCVVDDRPAGYVVPTQVEGDCRVNQCDGSGNVIQAIANSDVHEDGLECTQDVCNAGIPANPPLAADTACAQNGGHYCDGAGACVECNTWSQCAGTSTDCRTRACNAHLCGYDYVAAGTPTSAQTPNDCQVVACDGSGGVTSEHDDTDLPLDDGNQCTSPACVGGSPAFLPLPVDTPCDQSGGVVCDTQGSCVECNVAAQCAGADDECKTRTCEGNGCGLAFAPPGTPVSLQTARDCKQNECDGAGNTVSASLDTDVPFDGNQCTDDVCAAGVPSNPPVPPDTPCTDGGNFCDAAGTCVECNTAAQCPSGANECQVAVCETHSCGLGNLPPSTPTMTQTVGDCLQDECDGYGGIASSALDTDIPVDGNECTDDVCTAGVPSNPSMPLGTACDQNGGVVCDGASACIAPPQVALTQPVDGGGAAASTSIVVSFTRAMNASSLTAQTAIGACSGTVQLSSDDFATCVGFAASAPSMSSGDTVAMWVPAATLAESTTYKIRVTSGAVDTLGLPVVPFSQATGFMTGGSQTFAFTGDVQTFPVPAGFSLVTIKAWGGGGGSGFAGPARGGAGGFVQGTFGVGGGTVLAIDVAGGGRGGEGNNTGGQAGYGGGGTGGSGQGGGGGGRTLVTTGATVLVVVGGGGGSGSGGTPIAYTGGPGGGLVGGDGGYSYGATGGTGGTQIAPGLGGTGTSGDGAPGSGPLGGAGGISGVSGINAGNAGGGGGGGWFGGGGGGGAAGIGDGGGGGGSSFWDVSATGVLTIASSGSDAPNTTDFHYIAGVAAGASVAAGDGGNGLAVITWH